MQKTKSKKLGTFATIVLFCVVIATIASLISIKCFQVFTLNENQLLYLFSAMGQIIGCIFGLTLTAYVFFMDKFKDSTIEDDTLYDAVSALLNTYFHNLIILAVLCGSVVLICIVGIICLSNQVKIYPFIINEAVFLFLIGIATILIFGVMLLDPQKLSKELGRMKRDAEKNDPYSIKGNSGDFTTFLKTYNMLERLIKDFAEFRMGEQPISTYNTFAPKNRKPQIIQALEILNRYEIINNLLLEEINTFRIYRNGLVHGVNFDVAKDVCDRISEVYNTLKNAYDVFKLKGNTSEEWNTAINQVYDLTRN